MKMYEFEPTPKGLLNEWFHRYNPGVLDDRALWSFSFEERPGYGKSLDYKATLTAHSLREKQFEGRDWCFSRRLAEISAIEVFRADSEVQKIAQYLAPSQTIMKKKIRLNAAETKAFRASGIDTWKSMAEKELVQCAYISQVWGAEMRFWMAMLEFRIFTCLVLSCAHHMDGMCRKHWADASSKNAADLKRILW